MILVPLKVREGFAGRLKSARILAGHEEQKDGARALGVPAATYGRWERGETEPGLAALMNISVTFGVSIDVLVKGKKESA